MSRNTKITAVVMAVLLIAVAVLAWLNRGNVQDRRAMQESGTFLVTAGDLQFTISMDDVLKLGPQRISAVLRSGGRDGEPMVFAGVSLKSILDSLGIDYSSSRGISFMAADGYVSAILIAEALDEENCFIVFEEDGQPLGTRERGGRGPYMMIMAKDHFSQRWCKFLMEIVVS